MKLVILSEAKNLGIIVENRNWKIENVEVRALHAGHGHYRTICRPAITSMSTTNKVSKSRSIFVFAMPFVLVLAAYASCGAYLRAGTDLLGRYKSPDGKWEALILLRNGGAASDFSTLVTLVDTSMPLATSIAMCRPANVLVADSDHGAAPTGHLGQLQIKVNWQSSTELEINYPQHSRIFKQEAAFKSVRIHCIPSKAD